MAAPPSIPPSVLLLRFGRYRLPITAQALAHPSHRLGCTQAAEVSRRGSVQVHAGEASPPNCNFNE